MQMIRLILISLLLSGIFTKGSAELPCKIKKIIGTSSDCADFEIDGESLFPGKLLPLFYINRSYYSAWFSCDSLSSNGFELLRHISKLDQ